MPPTTPKTPNYVICQVRFRQSGLLLDFADTSATKFAAKIAGLPPNPSIPNAPPGPAHGWSASVPLFNSDDNKITLAYDRITHLLFASDDKNWWFYNPGFEPKDPNTQSTFQSTQILNNGTAVRTTFVPGAIYGELVPYNLIMRTVVWTSGTKNGHATIIIDPIVETGSIGH